VAAARGARLEGAREVLADGDGEFWTADEEATLWALPAEDLVEVKLEGKTDALSAEQPAAGLPAALPTTLAECLAHFQQPEKLTGDNRAKCTHCGTREDAEKTLAIWRAPPVLTVHLKRFKTGPGGFYGGQVVRKNNAKVDFPVFNLDLAPYVVGPPEAQALPEGLRAADGGGGGGGGGGDSDDWAAEGLGMAAAPAAAPAAAAAAPSYMYDLFAVSHHEGGLGGGHYTASVQDFATGKWWFCDDRDATPAFPEACRRESAYVLFYRRKDTLGPELAEANAVAAAEEGAASAANPAGGGGGGSGGGGGGGAVKRPRSPASSQSTQHRLPPTPPRLLLTNGSLSGGATPP
jgi:hypothetical protein